MGGLKFRLNFLPTNGNTKNNGKIIAPRKRLFRFREFTLALSGFCAPLEDRNCIFFFPLNYPITHFCRVFVCVQDESRIDDFTWQWKYIERSVDEMVPTSGNVQTAQFVVTTCLVFDCKSKMLLVENLFRIDWADLELCEIIEMEN